MSFLVCDTMSLCTVRLRDLPCAPAVPFAILISVLRERTVSHESTPADHALDKLAHLAPTSIAWNRVFCLARTTRVPRCGHRCRRGGRVDCFATNRTVLGRLSRLSSQCLLLQRQSRSAGQRRHSPLSANTLSEYLSRA
jgi:hypothetical protein